MGYSVPMMLIPFITGLAWIILFKISLPITKRYGEIGSPCLQPLSSGEDFDRYPNIYCSSSFWLHNITLHRKLSNAIFRPVNVNSLYQWIGLNHFVQNFTTKNKKVRRDCVALSTAPFDGKGFWPVLGHLLFFIFLTAQHSSSPQIE